MSNGTSIICLGQLIVSQFLYYLYNVEVVIRDKVGSIVYS